MNTKESSTTDFKDANIAKTFGQGNIAPSQAETERKPRLDHKLGRSCVGSLHSENINWQSEAQIAWEVAILFFLINKIQTEEENDQIDQLGTLEAKN